MCFASTHLEMQGAADERPGTQFHKRRFESLLPIPQPHEAPRFDVATLLGLSSFFAAVQVLRPSSSHNSKRACLPTFLRFRDSSVGWRSSSRLGHPPLLPLYTVQETHVLPGCEPVHQETHFIFVLGFILGFDLDPATFPSLRGT
jgi:hypothetical protein